jgi:predicted Na+-dependent transporter
LAVFYLATYVLLSFIGRLFFKPKDAVAMVFAVAMRNLSIALAIAMTAFGRQGLTIALLVALAYVIQIQSAAWYVRFVDKIIVPENHGRLYRGVHPGICASDRAVSAPAAANETGSS